MAAKKSTKSQNRWSVEDINEVAKKLLAMEEKNLKKWVKAPAINRGQDMSKALADKFGKLKKEDQLQLALWVDICIYLPTVLNSYQGHVALMEKDEALAKLIELEQSGELSIDEYLDWVSQFDCLLTEGSKSDIGAWFHDGFSELLSEIDAVTWTNTFYEDELSSSEVAKYLSSKSTKKRALAAASEQISEKDLALISKDANSGIRYCVAANPKTSSKELKELCKDSREDIRTAVAQNLSTPTEILEALAVDESGIVRASVALHSQTSTEVLKKLSKDKNSQVRASVAQNPKTTSAIMSSLSSDTDEIIQTALSTHPNTPSEIIEKLSKSKDMFIRSNIAERRDLPESILERLAKDKEDWVRRSLAENPTIPQSVIDLLSKDEDSLVREALIGNSSSLIDESLEVENSDSVKVALASNAKTPVHLLAELAKNEGMAFLDGSFKSIRATVAKNPSINQEIVEALFKTKDLQVLAALASNPKTPMKFIENLVEISLEKRSKKKWVPSDRELELGLAQNPNSPSDYLSKLSQHIDIWTVIRVASNPSLPISNLEALSKHKDEKVRSAVASNLSAPWALLEFLSNDEVDVREKVASNPNTRVDVLEKLGKDEYSSVRSGVASNPSTHPNLLKILHKDREPLTRLAVARNPNTSEEVLRELSKEDFREFHFIIGAVIDHPNTPAELRDSLLDSLINNDDSFDDVAASVNAPTDFLETLYKKYISEKPEDDFLKVTSTRYKVLLALSKNPSTPTEILANLASDRDTDFREAVATNPSAALETLEVLAK